MVNIFQVTFIYFQCIEPWIQNTPNCPVDRKPISKGSMHHDFIVENIIGDYMVSHFVTFGSKHHTVSIFASMYCFVPYS